MKTLKILFYLLFDKLPLLFLSVSIAAILGYFFNSYLIFGVAFIGISLYLYLNYRGVIHYVTKERLKLLVKEGNVENTEINPYSSDINLFKVPLNEWIKGEAIFDRVETKVFVNEVSGGILFYFFEMPYLSIHMIPKDKIISQETSTTVINSSDIDNKEDVAEIFFKNGKSIVLPVINKINGVRATLN